MWRRPPACWSAVPMHQAAHPPPRRLPRHGAATRGSGAPQCGDRMSWSPPVVGHARDASTMPRVGASVTMICARSPCSPARRMLNPLQKRRYREDGYVVLTQFKSPAALGALRSRAHEIVEAFDPLAGSGVFSTRQQNADAWFLGSADSVRCFFEEDAFDEHGSLRQPKALSINKIGHALHERDPAFAAFSHGPDWAELAADLGLQAPQLWQSMFIFKQ